MRSNDLNNIKFALKNPVYMVIISIGVLAIIFIAVFGPIFFNSLIGGELSGAKRGLSDLIYVLFVLSVTGPILLWIVFAAKRIVSKITKKEYINSETEFSFKLVGIILSSIFIILFIFMSTSFISVDSLKISQKIFLFNTNEISLNSIESINAIYSNGGNAEVFINYSGNKTELIVANGTKWEQVPYTESQIDYLFYEFNKKISTITVINNANYLSDKTAIEVVKNTIGKNSNYFTFKIQ
jgi:hypothetical protein